MDAITPARALKHPTWTMGSKITIDSATLMNKGLEVIEAHWLFGLPAERIEVIVHPQSIIHSMVEFMDGSVKAQLGIPDMKLPIQYALTYPERPPSAFQRVDFAALGQLTFQSPDMERFPCLSLAFRAMREGGTTPAVLNAANESAVQLFLEGRIGFTAIPELIAQAMDMLPSNGTLTLESIDRADRDARALVAQHAAVTSH
jgi:1-deoxy-D-xylulose-5-phosphate reductoisomerase